MECPLCHFEQPEGRIDCECCGLVFSKWKKKNAPAPPEPTQSDPAPGPITPKSSAESKPTPAQELRLYQRLGKLYLQRDENGTCSYYPWGNVWKGFKVEDEERLAKIERLETIFSCIHCPAVSILGLNCLLFLRFYPSQFGGWFLTLILYLTVSYLVFGVRSTQITWDLPFSLVKFDQGRYLKGFFKSFDFRLLLDLEVLALLLVLSCVYLLITGNLTMFFMNATPIVWKAWICISGGLLTFSTVYFYVLDGKFDLKKLLGGK
jgi:hypothetical protein